MTDNVMAPQRIMRSADHRYSYCDTHADFCDLSCPDRVWYPGVTSILSVLDKSGPLMAWAARQTAEAAVNLSRDGWEELLATVGREGTIKALTSRSSWQRDEAANLGTEVHGLADLVVRGVPTPPMAEGIRTRVLAYADWWQRSGWTLRLSEAMVVRPARSEFLETVGWGGTFDLLAKDADGRTVLADIKTGKGVYREATLQLAAYGLATLVQYTDGKVYPMPAIDRYVILHVTLDGVREIELSIGTAERMAFLACLDLWHWSESMKGKRL